MLNPLLSAAARKLITAAFTCFFAVNGVAQETASLVDAISNGSANLVFRYRIESVEQDGFPEDALASTLKLRLNYQTAKWRGLDLFAEADNVTHIGDDNFNSTRNDKVTYPVVADPSGTDINQFYIRSSGEHAALILGRQRVLKDNERFVGGVGWRQNEQTYDAFSLDLAPGWDIALSWQYVNRVSRIFGPDKGTPPRYLDSDSHFLHAAWNITNTDSLVAYGYLLDFDDAPELSTRTFGLRYSASFAAGPWSIPLNLEFARQEDYGDNGADLSVNYQLLEVGIKTGALTLLIGNEVLEGSTAGGFSTPLATLHKFQGWADKFLSTPATGIDDRYASVSGEVAGIDLSLSWHDFEADVGSANYGSEIDVAASRKFGDHLTGLVKLARYDADAFSTDTTKIWLMLTTSF